MAALLRAAFLAASGPGAASLLRSGDRRWELRQQQERAARDLDDGLQLPYWDFTGDNFSFAHEKLSAEAAFDAYVYGYGEADIRCVVYKSHFSFAEEDEGMLQELSDNVELNGSSELNVSLESNGSADGRDGLNGTDGFNGSAELNSSRELNANVEVGDSADNSPDDNYTDGFNNSPDGNQSANQSGSVEIVGSAELSAMLNAALNGTLDSVIKAQEMVKLSDELKSACLGSAWDGKRCQDVAFAIRHSTWPALTAATSGIPVFQHLQTHGKAPPLRTFRMGGGVAAEVSCRQGQGPTHLYYRHIYKAAGMAIKRNLALLSGKSPKGFIDASWRTHDRCQDLISRKSHGSPRPVLFTYIRDPMEKFIAGYKEIASRGLIDDFRGSKVGDVEHATLFLDNVFHGTCDNGHVLLQIQSMMGPSCESRFDFIGKVENLKPHWHKLGEAAGCTEKLYWPRNWGSASDDADHGAEEAMRLALAANGGKLTRALCIWLLPDYIAFDYPLPEACKASTDTTELPTVA